jgi:LPXTG-motif cell wall-anchored protein
MNVWMKRTLHTALLTGGLLAVGSGIASADDSIDVAVPVTVTDNALAVLGTSPGTTAPEIRLPAVEGLASVDLGAATVSVPVGVGGNSADVAGLDVAQPGAAPAPAGGNGSAVDAGAPVTVTGNAVAVLGGATAAGNTGPSSTSGGASVADVDVPVTVCGNGVGVLADATATCTTPTGSTTTGSTTAASTTAASTTAGSTTPLVDAAAPVTACGNGVGVLGDATGTCTAGPADGGPLDPSTPALAGGRPAPANPVNPADPADPAAGPFGTAAALPARSELGLLGTLDGALATTGGTSGTTDGSAASGRSTASLASTGTELTLSVLGGLLALLLGLALSVRARRRDVPLG